MASGVLTSLVIWMALVTCVAATGNSGSLEFDRPWPAGISLRTNQDNNWKSFWVGDDLLLTCAFHYTRTLASTTAPVFKWSFKGNQVPLDSNALGIVESLNTTDADGWSSTLSIADAGEMHYGMYQCRAVLPSGQVHQDNVTLQGKEYHFENGAPWSQYTGEFGKKLSFQCHSRHQNAEVKCVVEKLNADKSYTNWGEQCDEYNRHGAEVAPNQQRSYLVTVTEEYSGWWQCRIPKNQAASLRTLDFVNFTLLIKDLPPANINISAHAVLRSSSSHSNLPTVVVSGNSKTSSVLYIKDWTNGSAIDVNITCKVDETTYPSPNMHLSWNDPGILSGDMSRNARNLTASFAANSDLQPGATVVCNASNILGIAQSTVELRAGRGPHFYGVGVSWHSDDVIDDTTWTSVSAHVFGAPLGMFKACIKMELLKRNSRCVATSAWQMPDRNLTLTELNEDNDGVNIFFSWSSGHNHEGNSFAKATWTIGHNTSSNHSQLQLRDAFILRVWNPYLNNAARFRLMYDEALNPPDKLRQLPAMNHWPLAAETESLPATQPDAPHYTNAKPDSPPTTHTPDDTGSRSDSADGSYTPVGNGVRNITEQPEREEATQTSANPWVYVALGISVLSNAVMAMLVVHRRRSHAHRGCIKGLQ